MHRSVWLSGWLHNDHTSRISSERVLPGAAHLERGDPLLGAVVLDLQAQHVAVLRVAGLPAPLAVPAPSKKRPRAVQPLLYVKCCCSPI